MRDYNPIMEGIKKHGLAKNFFLELKERVNAGCGLTAREWDWYRARQKEWEPDVLAAEEAARRPARTRWTMPASFQLRICK